jgi:hypothetical protein
LSGLSNVFLFPVGGYSFRDALVDLAPYSPRLSYNFIDPTNSLFQGNTLTPVTTVTNPVGVVIDQTQGGLGNLGAELVTNGTFDANLTGWTAGSAITAVWDNGEADLTLNFTLGNNNTNWFSSGIVVPTGTATMFFVEFDATWISGGSLQVGTAFTSAANIAPNGGVKTRYRAICGLRGGTGNAFIPSSVAFASTAVARWKIDNVTCKAIPGNQATASSDAKRPLWNEFTVNGRTVRGAVFDGSDDCLQVQSFEMSNTSFVTAIAGYRTLTSGIGVLLELGPDASLAGGFGLFDPSSLTSPERTDGFRSTNAARVSSPELLVPQTKHLACVGNRVAPLLSITRNGVLTGSTTFAHGGASYANSTLNIGGRNNSATFPFNGAYSYLFICGVIPPDDILTKIYRGLAPQIGVAV